MYLKWILPDLLSWSSDFPCLFLCLSLPPLSCFLQGLDSHDSRINSLSADFDRERVTMESTLSSVRQQVMPGSLMHCLTANNQPDRFLFYTERSGLFLALYFQLIKISEPCSSWESLIFLFSQIVIDFHQNSY